MYSTRSSTGLVSHVAADMKGAGYIFHECSAPNNQWQGFRDACSEFVCAMIVQDSLDVPGVLGYEV